MGLLRVNFCVSVNGEREGVDELSQLIADLSGQGLPPSDCTPSAPWPLDVESMQEGKFIDIHLTVDAMRATATMSVDRIVHVSGN